MKKKYVKPQVVFERFELTKHVADCAWELVNSGKENCFAQADPDFMPGFPNLFMKEGNGCVVTSDAYQDYCYQDGAQGVNVFAS